MQDLELTKQFDGKQQFEVDGADAARAFVLEHGLSDEKVEVGRSCIHGFTSPNWNAMLALSPFTE